MTALESAQQKLTRLKMCLAYLKQVDPGKVYLAYYIGTSNRVDKCRERHLRAEGQEWQTCGTVACLAGVLITIPEIKRDYESQMSIRIFASEVLARVEHLIAWLDVDGTILFLPRLSSEIYGSDFEVAVKRLENEIENTKQMIGGSYE